MVEASQTGTTDAERHARKLGKPTFLVFGLTRSGIEPESAVLTANAQSTRPLIGLKE